MTDNERVSAKSPVSREQIQMLRQTLKDIATLEKHVDNADRAGMDVSETRKQLSDLKKKAQLFLEVYGNAV